MLSVRRMRAQGVSHNISPNPGTITRPSGRAFADISSNRRAGMTNQQQLKATAAPNKTVKPHMLPESFEPGPFDVICARGKAARDHPGE